MANSITLTLELPLSKNREPNGRHWSVQYTYKRAWALQAFATWCLSGSPRLDRVRITPIFYVKRKRDPDNLFGLAFKGIIDGLKGHLMPDDGPDYLALAEAIQIVDGKRPRLELVCEEVTK